MFDLQYIPPKYYNFYRQIPLGPQSQPEILFRILLQQFSMFSDQNDCAETQTING